MAVYYFIITDNIEEWRMERQNDFVNGDDER